MHLIPPNGTLQRFNNSVVTINFPTVYRQIVNCWMAIIRFLLSLFSLL
jgi:hypothetical protein